MAFLTFGTLAAVLELELDLEVVAGAGFVPELSIFIFGEPPKACL